MEIVDSVVSSGVTCSSKIRYVGLREKVGDISSGVNDRSANDTNSIRDISASDVGLKERIMNLSGIDWIAGLSV